METGPRSGHDEARPAKREDQSMSSPRSSSSRPKARCRFHQHGLGLASSHMSACISLADWGVVMTTGDLNAASLEHGRG